MSNTKHTPGPWHVDTDNNGRYTIVKAAPNKMVAISNRTSGINGTPTEVEANAKLIAAAPELLDALIDLYNHTLGLNGAYTEDRAFLNAWHVLHKLGLSGLSTF